MHDDISPVRFVIPGLTRNPVFPWISAFAGMTIFAVIKDAVYKRQFVMTLLEKISKLLNRWFIWIGGAALLAMIGIACANMLLRPLGAPLKGAYELVGFVGALTIAFALGYTQISHSHISVDILSTRYSKRTRKIMDAISSILCILFFLLVAWQTFV